MPTNNIPRLSFNNMTGKAQVMNPSGLAPKTPLTQKGGKFNLGNTLGSIAGTVGGVLGGPVGWIGLGIQAIGDNIKAARSQFDLQGMKDSINDYESDFNQFAGSVDNSSDILSLASMMGDDLFSDEINNSGYEWDGNILSGIGAIFGNAATERDKQSARDAVSKMQLQQGIALNNAVTTVGNKDYRRRMANYFNSAAFGGPLNTHGADFSDDIIRIDAGGTHEQNPIGGVPAGLDPMGFPNLVEEGERIWDDYVFSDRLKMPKSLVNKYKLGGKKNKSMSFAEGVDKISEKLGTELRPNDPITKRTKDAILSEFEEVQEEKRLQQEKRDLLKAVAEMTPEEFAAMLQSTGQQPVAAQTPAETMPAEEQVPPQGMNEGMVEELSGIEPELGITGMAYGGPMFKKGGKEQKPQNISTISLLKGIQPGELSAMELLRLANKKKGSENTSVTTTSPKPTAKSTTTKASTSKTPVLPDWTSDLDAQADAILGMTPEVPDFSIDIKDTPLTVSKMSIPVTRPELKDLPTWMRYAPAVGGGLAVLSDLFDPGDYSGAESLLSDSRRLSNPVHIPVTTIGNRVRRNPFDERLMVNQANQNLAAGLRTTLDNAGGNRAYRQYATSQLARDNQGTRSEIARNAYLANRQDALQTEDFNRQTDLYNMNALNQRNLTEAQLNSSRQIQGFNARLNALNYLDSLKRQDEQLAAGDMTAFLTSLGNIGNENEQRNWLTGLAREGVLNYTLGNNGRVGFVPSKNGGKIKTKKRRF